MRKEVITVVGYVFVLLIITLVAKADHIPDVNLTNRYIVATGAYLCCLLSNNKK